MKKMVEIKNQYVTFEKMGEIEKYHTMSQLSLMDEEDAQELIDNSLYDGYIDVEDSYKERNPRLNKFLGTYKVTPELHSEYNKFLSKMYALKNRMSLKYLHEFDLIPTFEEWKKGKKKFKGNNMKLGKFLKNFGFDDEVISFYASQSKNGDEMYFTISDTAYDILGMTEHSDGSWTSCQSLDSKIEHNQCLVGSLNDENLVVGFLHYELEDVLDFSEKVVARTVLRLFEFEGQDVLISTSYYGSSHAQNQLSNILKSLEKYGILSKDSHARNIDSGTVLKEQHDDYISEVQSETYEIIQIDEWVDIECPYCEGDGKIERENQYGKEVKFTCPVCNGTKEYQANVHYDSEETLETTSNETIRPYSESYKFESEVYLGTVSKIVVDADYIKAVLKGETPDSHNILFDLEEDEFSVILKLLYDFGDLEIEHDKIIRKITESIYYGSDDIFKELKLAWGMEVMKLHVDEMQVRELLWFDDYQDDSFDGSKYKFLSVDSDNGNHRISKSSALKTHKEIMRVKSLIKFLKSHDVYENVLADIEMSKILEV